MDLRDRMMQARILLPLSFTGVTAGFLVAGHLAGITSWMFRHPYLASLIGIPGLILEYVLIWRFLFPVSWWMRKLRTDDSFAFIPCTETDELADPDPNPLLAVGTFTRDAFGDCTRRLESRGVTRKEIVDVLASDLNSRSRAAHSAAVRGLGKLGDTSVVPHLIAALGRKASASYDDRRAIIEALGLLGDPRATEPLLSELRNPELAAPAAEALGRIRDRRAVEPLFTLLVPETGEYRLRVVVSALARLRDDRAVAPLVSLLGANGGEGLRMDIVVALGRIGSDRAVPALIEACGDQGLRLAAASALVRIGQPAGLQDARRRVIEPLANELVTLVRNAVVALSSQEGVKCTYTTTYRDGLLVSSTREEPFFGDIRQKCRLLRDIGDRATVPLLKALLASIPKEVRRRNREAVFKRKGEVVANPIRVSIEALVSALEKDLDP